MKKFINKTILFVLPVFILIVSVNYFGDAARLFANDYEKGMAEIISNGYNVTNISNFDERLFQKEIIFNKNVIQPDIVVLGSSRSMHINSNLFPNTSFFNSSVSGASIEDLIGIYQLYKENNKLPKKIIIGIDPWMFKENKNNTGRWKSISEYYYNFYGIKKTTQSFDKYKELYSISYFQSSLKLIPNLFLSENEPAQTKNKYNKLNTKLTDGSLVYGVSFRDATQSEIDAKIKKYIKGDIYNIEGMHEISKNKFKEFEKLINELKNNKLEIVFFLAPYAPTVYDFLEKKYKVVIEVEKVIRDFAILKNIQIYGSYDPYLFDLDKTCFYDGMHCKENAINEIFRHN